MTTEKLFQYSVADACRELVILPTDSWEEQRTKESNAGGFVGNPYDTADPDNNVDNIALRFEKMLKNRLSIHKRRPKYGKKPEEVIEDIQQEILYPFYPLLLLAAVKHPVLISFGIEEIPLRSALYYGAERVISGTKLALADYALGAEQLETNTLFFENATTPESEDANKRIAVLERFQEKLIAKFIS